MSTMAQLAPAPQTCQITGGVDTHKDTHTVAALDPTGRMLGHYQFPATPAGYATLLEWLRSHGDLARVGVEGTGVYGAGLALYLHTAGVEVVEVDRPDRKTRRWQGKSDPVDAEAAARAVLSGRATGTPKQRDGRVEALRTLRVARRSAISNRAQAQIQMKSLVVTAPETLRTRLREMTTRELVTHLRRSTPRPRPRRRPRHRRPDHPTQPGQTPPAAHR
ncbi:MAG: transposase [Pseudonocardia sp.]